MRNEITAARRWVIHVENRLISGPQGLDQGMVEQLASQVATLRQRGIEVVVVSAAASAACPERVDATPLPLHEAQAWAAIGQIALTNSWNQGLLACGVQSAQILLTQDDLSHRKHYLNARSTLQVLLGLGVVPVVSENGTIASHGIRAGDTHSLGALVVNLVQADVYVLLAELDGLLGAAQTLEVADSGQGGTLIGQADASDAALDRCAHDMTEHFGADIRSWLRSARLAARSGAHTVIACGRRDQVLIEVASGAAVGTLLVSDTHPAASRGRWLANQLPMRGALEIIAGFQGAVTGSDGVTALMILRVEGVFQRGDMVVCRGADGVELARGLVNYNSQEIARLRGQFVEGFVRQIGYVAEPAVISAENLVAYGAS